MIWVPPLVFDPYCRDKLLPLRNEFTQESTQKKNVYNSYERILKNQE